MMNAARQVRSKSPFRRARSKSPSGVRDRRALSPFRRPFWNSRGSNGAVDESEINVFQQLRIDRHDESAAIEILLDDPPEKELLKMELPELNTTSSASSDPTCSSRALSKETAHSRSTSTARGSSSSSERKVPFFKRFFKSPRKQHALDELTKFPSIPVRSLPESHPSDFHEDMKFPILPPSRVSRSRSSVVSSPPPPPPTPPPPPPPPAPIADRVLSDRSDNFSNMSSISGSHLTGLKPPVHFDRQESLGLDSIKDVRKALKQMEKQLGRATSNGERVSRQRVMRALFTVADSLEDVEERDLLRSELEGMMRKERAVHPMIERPLSPLSVASSDDDKSDMTTSDDEDYAESQTPSSQPSSSLVNTKENAPAGFFNSLGGLLGMSNEEKFAVEQALDDLLWTEFVAARKASIAKPQRNKAQRIRQSNGVHTLQTACDRKPETNRQAFNDIPLNQSQRVLLGDPTRVHRARSWWRNHPTSQHGDDADDEDSCSSEEFPSYLPTSITVKKQTGRTTNEGRLSTQLYSNPRYKVKMVDTESRCGYEMGSTTSSRK